MDIKPDLNKLRDAGPIKYTRDFPPAHFTLKVQSFSSLSNSPEEKYESGEFESGGYNWKLSIYPTGDKKRNGAGYISLYLSVSDTSTLPLGWEVLVNYKLFVFDQLRDKYLAVHDNNGGIRRFNNINKEWGFTQLVSLDTFKEASNGYLVNDSCMFGAEVLVIKYSGIWEWLSVVKEPDEKTYTWKVSYFSSLPSLHCSELFKTNNFCWRLKLYSKGFGGYSGTHMSLYLEFLDLPPEKALTAKFTVRIRDEVHGHHYEEKCKTKRFDSSNCIWASPEFLPLNDLKNYLTNDSIILEVEFLAMPHIEIIHPSITYRYPDLM